ncbi:MAG: PAS domain-containing sensor histidine kinase [Planctomycetota bacterium]|nr:MAG: PAS domain-containing sensor histidine kinase [Planctomycetota bacterium]
MLRSPLGRRLLLDTALVAVGAAAGAALVASQPLAAGGAALVAGLLVGLVRLAAQRRRLLEPLAAATRAAEAALREEGAAEPPQPGGAPARLGAFGRAADEVGALLRALERLVPSFARERARARGEGLELATVLASLEEGVLAVDRAQRLVHANQAALRILDSPLRAPAGKPIWELTRLRALHALLAAALADGERHQQELILPGPGGDRVLAVQVTPLRPGGEELAGAVAVLRDVTALRRLERMRQQFVANVSHELKTPLTAIRAMVETLADEPEMPAERRQRFLARVAEQTARLQAMVEDLLALGRMESGREAPAAEPVQLDGIARVAAATLAPAAERKGLRLLTQIESPVTVRGDAAALRRLIDNLLDNAIKYTDRGEVRLRLAVERTGAAPMAVLQVADTGIGVPARHLDRIFERFYRVEQARERLPGDRGGSGLGLAIAKHIARSHGGTIEVSSELGRGSTFTVRLPLGGPGPAALG